PEMKHESKGVPIAWVRWRLDACSEAPASYCAVAVGTSVDPTPPARIRTCRIAAYGSYLGCLALKRRLGWGWRIILTCCFTHTVQVAQLASPALGPGRGRLPDVLLGRSPSLHALRGCLLTLVRAL